MVKALNKLGYNSDGQKINEDRNENESSKINDSESSSVNKK